MAIPRRTLTKWRKEALKAITIEQKFVDPNEYKEVIVKQADIILRMTQELLDQHLLKETT